MTIIKGSFLLGLLLYVPGVLIFTPVSIIYVIVTSIYNFIWPDWIQDEKTERAFFTDKIHTENTERAFLMLKVNLFELFSLSLKRFQERLQTSL